LQKIWTPRWKRRKKKAARRIYSERAILADHSLTVPRPETEEDRQLDKKLRAMDAEAEARPALSPMTQTPRPATVVPRPAEDNNNNWLAAAVLDASSSVPPDPDADAEQIEDEIRWHQRLKEKSSTRNQSNPQAENNLSNRITSQPGLPELDSLKKYQLNSSGGLNAENSSAPGYLTPQDRSVNPLTAIRQTPKQEPAAPTLFSPEAARLSSAAKPPSITVRPVSGLPATGVPEQKSSQVFSYDRAQGTTQQPSLNPLDQIRKTSPINKPNPFAEDPMPTIKRSIWE
jgi:hypothetical protein